MLYPAPSTGLISERLHLNLLLEIEVENFTKFHKIHKKNHKIHRNRGRDKLSIKINSGLGLTKQVDTFSYITVRERFNKNYYLDKAIREVVEVIQPKSTGLS